MGKRMPSFKSIEAFVVVARALSFTEAASALHLTVPAVSRRIKSLETELGVSLFHRKPRALQLTEAGESYLSHLAPAIETIRHASDRVRGHSHGHSLKVSLPASLAANWLVPRLPSFHAEHRGIQIELQSMNGCADLDASEADLAVWPGTGDWPGLRAQRLLDMDLSGLRRGFSRRRPAAAKLGPSPAMSAARDRGPGGFLAGVVAGRRRRRTRARAAGLRQFPSSLSSRGIRSRGRARRGRDRRALPRGVPARPPVRRFVPAHQRILRGLPEQRLDATADRHVPAMAHDASGWIQDRVQLMV